MCGTQPIVAGGGGGGANPKARTGRGGVQTCWRLTRQFLEGGGRSVPVPVLPGALSEYCPEQRSEPPGRGPLFPSPSPPALAVLFALVSAVPVGAITALAGPARCPRASLSRCGGTADLPRLSAGSTGIASRAGSLRRERLGSDRTRPGAGRVQGPGRGLPQTAVASRRTRAPRCSVQYPFDNRSL